MKNTFGKILIIAGVLMAFFVLARGLYYAPNDDSGLSLANTGSLYVATTTRGLPERLLIPKLNIDTDVQHVGVTKNGNMAAPNNFTDVSWYKYGTVPGNKGSAVMAGHQDNALSLDGVFKRLNELELGDKIYVIDKNGKRLAFEVVDEEIYNYDDKRPLDRIFHDDDASYLVLITCAGKWLPSAKTNDKRLVIYARLVTSQN